MRICIVNLEGLPALSREHKSLRIGGAEVQRALLAAALARRGHEVSLVVADHGQVDGARIDGVTLLKAFKESEGLPVLRFLYPRWTKVWAALNRADADIYYCSSAGMLVGLLAMFCGLRHRRLVFRVAIDSDCEPSQLMIRYARDRRLYEFGLRRADSILVQSVTQQRAMLKNYGRQSTVTRSFVAKPRSSDSGRLKDVDVLWVSNIRQIKRPDRLLALAREMPRVRFHMAGGPSPGEEDLYRSTEHEARGVANLEFHGAIPYLDIGLLFDRAKVFANTSDLEGFPNTFLQAWVRGIPVVTMFDPDGVVRRKGLGSSHSSLEDMAAGLAKMLDSADAYQQASYASLEFMGEHHDEEKILAIYLEAFTGDGNAASEEPTKASVV